MTFRLLTLAAAASLFAVPALAASKPMHPHVVVHHPHAMHMMHGKGMVMHGSPASADNSADELNAKQLQSAAPAAPAAPAAK
jgi:hypothetical protein